MASRRTVPKSQHPARTQSPKSRHVRKPPRVCLLRVVRKSDGARLGFVGQLDASGYIVSSTLAHSSAEGSPAYWPSVRSSVPDGCYIEASFILRSGRSETTDLEMTVWRRIRADGRLASPSARGLRKLRTARAIATAKHRIACRQRRDNRGGLQWGHRCKFAQTHAQAAA